jgi:hypothetical protein
MPRFTVDFTRKDLNTLPSSLAGNQDGIKEPLNKSPVERVAGAMRMIARHATKVPSRSLSTRSATTQAPHCAETRMGRLPRHGQRSLGCGSGSMGAPFNDFSCGSLRPFPLHAARVRVRGAFPGDLLCRSACEGGQPFAAPRFAHLIPESLRRARVGFVQRFLKLAGTNMR